MIENKETPAAEPEPGTSLADDLKSLEKDGFIPNEGDPNPAEVDTSVNLPGWVPDKFKTGEAFRDSYLEMERKQSAPDDATATADAAAPTDLKIADKEKGDAGDEGKLDQATLDKLGSEWISNGGKLSEESYKDLETKYGLTKEVVNSFGKAQQVSAQAEQTRTLQDAGVSPDDWGKMEAWARTNWSEEQIASWNGLAQSNDPNHRTLALKSLAEEYGTAAGQGQQKQDTILNGQTDAGGVQPIKNTAGLMAAMNDERYDTDPDYRAQVERRILAGSRS